MYYHEKRITHLSKSEKIEIIFLKAKIYLIYILLKALNYFFEGPLFVYNTSWEIVSSNDNFLGIVMEPFSFIIAFISHNSIQSSIPDFSFSPYFIIFSFIFTNIKSLCQFLVNWVRRVWKKLNINSLIW